MKKLKNQHNLDYKNENVPLQNPVAKFAHQFNKSHIFCDKSKYRRNLKHRKQEAVPMVLDRAIGTAFCIAKSTIAETASIY
ncbi:MAG: hypothetical protein Q7U57_12475 [Methylovulum sp.]|nr:hypothetical protein [Methylovulum sp.]